MMQRLRKENKIDFAIRDWDLLHVAQPIVNVLYAMTLSLPAAHFDHLGGRIDRDDFRCALRQQERKCSLACAQVGDG